VIVYRLSSSRFPPNSGAGAALNGGRWNPPGVEVIYASATRPLAVLEILVRYSLLPRDFVVTPIVIPDDLKTVTVEQSQLRPGWNKPSASLRATQQMGKRWLERGATAVLRVPSAVIPEDWNYVLNVKHPSFTRIRFEPSEPFHFDPRLK
jgi:RES domain-containing protein